MAPRNSVATTKKSWVAGQKAPASWFIYALRSYGIGTCVRGVALIPLFPQKRDSAASLQAHRCIVIPYPQASDFGQ